MATPETAAMPRARARRRRFCGLGLAIVLAALAASRTPAAAAVVEEVETPGGERYALFTPSPESGTRPDGAVLLVLDTRGRAVSALEAFRPAAERFGYTVLSSYATRSDLPAGTPDPNEPAVRALLDEAQTQYGASPGRIYLAGFSGTSRFAWMAGKVFPDLVGGIVGCGAGLPGPWADWKDVGFAYFGTAGRTDFNHREMRELDRTLDGVLVHRFAYFDGGHQWLDSETATQALAFFELEAMRRGRRGRDAALIEQLLAERLAAAAAAETGGELYRAATLLEAAAEDFEGLVSVDRTDGVRDRAEALAGNAEVRAAREAHDRAVGAELEYRDRVGAVVRGIAYDAQPGSAKTLARELEIETLKEIAGGDSLEADSARRRLETAFVQLAFYTPRVLEPKAPRRAALCLELATRIRPGSSQLWLRLARAHARGGQAKAALAALEQAVELGGVGADDLDDEAFTSLGRNPAFAALRQRVR